MQKWASDRFCQSVFPLFLCWSVTDPWDIGLPPSVFLEHDSFYAILGTGKKQLRKGISNDLQTPEELIRLSQKFFYFLETSFASAPEDLKINLCSVLHDISWDPSIDVHRESNASVIIASKQFKDITLASYLWAASNFPNVLKEIRASSDENRSSLLSTLRGSIPVFLIFSEQKF